MNAKYLELVLFLDDSSKNIQSFMRGELIPFGQDTYIDKGPIFDALLQSDRYDDTVDMMLQVHLEIHLGMGSTKMYFHVRQRQFDKLAVQ
jgi:hypothetical protein